MRHNIGHSSIHQRNFETCEDFVWGGLSRPLFLSSGRNFLDKSLEALGQMRLGAIH